MTAVVEYSEYLVTEAKLTKHEARKIESNRECQLHVEH